VCLANALYPLVEDVEALESMIPHYTETLDRARAENVAAKLGLRSLSDDEIGPNGQARIPDGVLVDDLLELLAAVETDYTLFYRHLAQVQVEQSETLSDAELLAPLEIAFYDAKAVGAEHRAGLVHWLRRYASRVREDGTPDTERRANMDRVNPKYVLRNYVAQLAIDGAEKGDPTVLLELLDVLRHPFDEQLGKERFAEKRPDWARDRPGCSMLSCSS
jgi:uncharacterized protein YdiU (UPF0061 family)